jgi:putative flippase GtrA
MAPPPASAYSEQVVTADLRVEALAQPLRGWTSQRVQAIRFMRYVVVAGLSSLVYLGLFVTLLALGTHYLAAGILSYLSAMVTHFTVNREWTFGRGVRRIQVQALWYVAIQLALGAANVSLLHLFVVGGLRPILLAQIVAAATLFPVSFVASQRWSFR